LIEYGKTHTRSVEPLLEWYSKINKSSATNLHTLRRDFANTVDAVGKYTVFNIGGNSYRLIASIHYNRQKVYTIAIWTHAEYDKRENKNKLKNGEL
jgi:mRNA interferase HigB